MKTERIGGTRYAWLTEEIEGVRTPMFHVIAPAGGQAAPRGVLPRSYTDFVSEIGEARLFRKANYYLLGVKATPEPGVSAKGEPLLCIGHFDSARAYFRVEELLPGAEPPVLEWEASLRESAPRFDLWIERRVEACRRRYRKLEWEQIVRGPTPFSKEEIATVEARARVLWRVLAVTPDSVVRFEIRNQSDRTLSYISIDVRWGRMRGRVFIPTATIPPGCTGVVEKKVYPHADPTKLEFFDPPLPSPEERPHYWEFKAPTQS